MAWRCRPRRTAALVVGSCWCRNHNRTHEKQEARCKGRREEIGKCREKWESRSSKRSPQMFKGNTLKGESYLFDTRYEGNITVTLTNCVSLAQFVRPTNFAPIFRIEVMEPAASETRPHTGDGRSGNEHHLIARRSSEALRRCAAPVGLSPPHPLFE